MTEHHIPQGATEVTPDRLSLPKPTLRLLDNLMRRHHRMRALQRDGASTRWTGDVRTVSGSIGSGYVAIGRMMALSGFLAGRKILHNAPLLVGWHLSRDNPLAWVAAVRDAPDGTEILIEDQASDWYTSPKGAKTFAEDLAEVLEAAAARSCRVTLTLQSTAKPLPPVEAITRAMTWAVDRPDLDGFTFCESRRRADLPLLWEERDTVHIPRRSKLSALVRGLTTQEYP